MDRAQQWISWEDIGFVSKIWEMFKGTKNI
jgi:hypothetical protein